MTAIGYAEDGHSTGLPIRFSSVLVGKYSISKTDLPNNAQKDKYHFAGFKISYRVQI